MDLLLIKVPYRISSSKVISGFDHDAPPLGIFILKAYLDQFGYDVKAMHMMSQEDYTEIKDIILAGNAKLIGLSATTYEFEQALSLARKLKQLNNSLYIIMGGPHVSYNYEEALEHDCVDLVSLFEGEETLREIIDNLNGKDVENKEKIRGIAYKENGNIIVTPERDKLNLDSIPTISYKELDLSRYDQPGSLVTSRGCVGRCIFCTAANTKYRERSAEKVFEDICNLYHNAGISEIAILENSFTINEKRTRRICDLLIKENMPIRWSCEARVETSIELLKLMKEAGCYAVQFGIESANDKTLKNIRKGINIKQISEAINNALAVGIENICCNYIIGLPGDTKESLMNTFEYMRKFKGNRRVRQSISVLTPYPGTYIYNHADEMGVKIISKDWKRYNGMDVVGETKNLSAKEIRKLYFDAYNEFYVPSYKEFF